MARPGTEALQVCGDRAGQRGPAGRHIILPSLCGLLFTRSACPQPSSAFHVVPPGSTSATEQTAVSSPANSKETKRVGNSSNLKQR